MRNIMLFIFLIIMSSCGKMHVFYLNTNTNNDAEKYVFENDTIRIVYNLWEPRGRLNYEIYNKLNVPIFIDWKNSAFVMNDEFTPYWKDVTSARLSGGAISYYGVTSSSASAISTKEDRISFIPPHSKIVKRNHQALCANDHPTKKECSMHFRNYIAYSIDEDNKNEHYLDCDFRVIEVKQIKRFATNLEKSPKKFYTYK